MQISRKNMVTLGTIPVLAAILASCDKAASNTKSSTASTAAADAETKSMTKEEAGKFYEEQIKGPNDATTAYSKAYYSGDIVALTTACQQYSDAATSAASKIEKAHWPEDAEKYAKAVAKNLRSEAKNFEALTKATTLSEVDSIAASQPAPDNSASVAIRKVLDLPAPGSAFQPFSFAGAQFTGLSAWGSGQVSVTLKNELSATAYNVGVTLNLMNASGAVIGNALGSMQGPVDSGQTAVITVDIDAAYIADTKTADVVTAQWATGSASNRDLQQADIEADPFPIG